MKTNIRQSKFLAEYLKSSNATGAAKKAGYSSKTAYSTGQRLLKNDVISRAISEQLGKSEINIQNVIQQIADIAQNSKNEFAQLKALDMLMRHLGGYLPEREPGMERQRPVIICHDEESKQLLTKFLES